MFETTSHSLPPLLLHSKLYIREIFLIPPLQKRSNTDVFGPEQQDSASTTLPPHQRFQRWRHIPVRIPRQSYTLCIYNSCARDGEG
ncbi:hypothetical protein V6N13_140602 [Hibiscus sabdariffa]